MVGFENAATHPELFVGESLPLLGSAPTTLAP